MKFDVEKYLDRIHFSDKVVPNLQTLKKLQKTHLLHVPFENLDIHAHIPITLSIDQIFDKVVNQNRGGFCYELNGLFYELLLALGFDAIRVSARVYDENKGYGKEFDHFAILVTLNHTNYLTDVGFGEFTFEPLAVQLGTIQNDERGTYVMDRYEGKYFRVNKMGQGQLTPEYIFDETPRKFSDFEGMCTYHQTSPESHFTKKRLITMPTENGRITITENILKLREGPSTQEIVLKNEAEYGKALWDRFQLKI